jgi:hypothetical protein
MTRSLRRIRRLPRPLVLLLVVGAIEAVAWSVVVAPLQGPDEGSHFAYTQRLVERGELPRPSVANASSVSSEVNLASRWGGLAPTVGNPQARPSWTKLEEGSFKELEETLPEDARSNGTGPNAARNNPPLYYLWAGLAYAIGYDGDLFARLQLMRLANIPLFLVVIGLTWALTAELLPRPRWARATAAAVVTVHPQLAHFAGVVGPDMMLSAIWAGFLYTAVLLVRRGLQLRLLTALALLCSASLLTHPRGLPILVPAVAAVVLAALRDRESVRRILPRFAAVCGLAAIPLIVYLVSIAGEPVISGSAATSTSAFKVREFGSYVWQFYLPQLGFMNTTVLLEDFGADRAFIRLFYGAFASQEVLFAPEVYEWLRWLTLAGLAGLAVAIARRWTALRRHWRPLLVLGAAIVALLTGIHYSEYRELAREPGAAQIVGRYLLPLMPLFGLAIAFTASALPRNAGRITAAVIVASGCLLQLAGLGLTFSRFYA